MRFALGIDTGGTYTDAVLVEQDGGNVVASAKALTTRHDLAVGISQAVERVLAAGSELEPPAVPGDVAFAGLSTTLATNAMVEGQGSPACLMLIGYDRTLMQRYSFEKDLGTPHFAYVDGGHTQAGDEAAPLDEAAIRRIAIEWQDRVEAFAVSGYFGVHNPEHELRARAIIAAATGMPVTCGHELSSRLNAVRRATTAALNARLISPLCELIAAVEAVLVKRGIHAPLMVVKGDGSLVKAPWAMQRPIETILSGPAASVMGGWHLAGRGDAWVVDVGGTTTDIAVLRDGWPRLSGDGASVGGWRTMVQAIDVHTSGLGGDSHVRWRDGGEGLAIGPRRTVPLSRLAASYPAVAEELALQARGVIEGHASLAGQFLMAWRPFSGALGEPEAQLLAQLAAGPRSAASLFGKQRGSTLLRMRADAMAAQGWVQWAAFTPSDALHVLGELDLWDAAAARSGAELMARQAGMDPLELCRRVVAGVSERAARALVEKVLEDATGSPPDWEGEPAAAALFARGMAERAGDELRLQFILGRPIVAIGAPVAAYMPGVAQRLGTELVIPNHAEVANAVGAAAGGVVLRVNASIARLAADDERLRLFSPLGCVEFSGLDAAIAYAEEHLRPHAEALAHEAGADQVEVKLTREDLWLPAGLAPDGTPNLVYMGSELAYVAAGRPAVAKG